MVSFKTLSVFLSIGIFGLQALAGPIPNQDPTQITKFKATRHADQDSTLSSLNNILRKRLSEFIDDLRSPPAGDSSSHRRNTEEHPDTIAAPKHQPLASRAISQNIEVQTVILTPEEKEILRERLSYRAPLFDAPGLREVSSPLFLTALLILGSIAGALFLVFPVGWVLKKIF
ncbi:hypothetical protein TWF730_010951 [Orbilia blumenaviensis]|uniref:Uncharacterized protein n=1 Tax=Orbilia blumenaviensis TaxID=1796055 RepID=A0AAV9UIZ7_9PEZI